MVTGFRHVAAAAVMSWCAIAASQANPLQNADAFLQAIRESQTLLDTIAFRGDFVTTTRFGQSNDKIQYSEGRIVLSREGDRFRRVAESTSTTINGQTGTNYARTDSRYDGVRVEVHSIWGETNHEGIPLERFLEPREERPGIEWEEAWWVQWPEDPDELDSNSVARPYPLFGALSHSEDVRLDALISVLTVESEPWNAPSATGFAHAIGRRFWGPAADIRVWLSPDADNRVVGLTMDIGEGATEFGLSPMRLELKELSVAESGGRILPERGEYTIMRPTMFNNHRGDPFDSESSVSSTVNVRLSEFSFESGREPSYFQHTIPAGTELDSPWNRLWIAQADGRTLKRAPDTVDSVMRTIKRESRTARHTVKD